MAEHQSQQQQQIQRKSLAELIAESSRLVQQSLVISSKLADIQVQIELRTKKLLDGKTSSDEIPIVDPPPK